MAPVDGIDADGLSGEPVTDDWGLEGELGAMGL
jgi:hypothetical protein